MAARQRSIGLALCLMVGGLAAGVWWSNPAAVRAQQGVYPAPAAPRGYTAEPPLAGSSAVPQAAPSAPEVPALRPTPAPLGASTPLPSEPPVPVVAIHVRVAATASAGQELEYRLCVQNHSQASAHHVLVRDPLPATAQYVRATPEPTTRQPELQWALGTLAAGSCKTITLILRPTGAGDVVNCARVQFEHGECVTTHIGGTAAPPRPAPVARPTMPTLTLQKLGPAQGIRYKSMLDYQLSVCNTGQSAITDIKLTDVLPDGLDYVSDGKGSDAPRMALDPSTHRNLLTWTVGTLQPGKCHTVTYRAIAKLGGRLTNRAVVTAAGGVRQQAESTVTITEPAVKLDAVGPRTRYVRVPATYELTVRNTGTSPLTNVVLRHPMPAGTTFRRASAGGHWDGTAVRWSLGTLQPGAACKVQITWEALQPGRLSVHPVLTAEPGQTAQTDISTDFVAASGLSLSVADKDDPVEVKEKTAYRITVLNQGQVAATHIRIVATAPAQEKILPALTNAQRSQVSLDQRTLTFEPFALAAGQKVVLEVPVESVLPGDARFHVTMTADQLTSGKVIAEESTTIYEESPAGVPAQTSGREAADKAQPVPPASSRR